jgi:hypothetical protein
LTNKKLESLAYRLRDLDSLRQLFAELNFEFDNKPVNKEQWSQDQKKIIQEARIFAQRGDYHVYYLQINTDSIKQWKGIASKIIKENHGLCMICSHDPKGSKWIFSSLSKEFSKSFSETRHVPIDIKPDVGIPKTFVDFLEKIVLSSDSTATSIVSKISDAFDSFAVEIHDELTVNVFEALKTLSEGIILNKSNGLILNEQTLAEIREPIFILLYRIIFILYAEDRGIFPTEQQIYQEEFSFKWIRQEWILKSDNQRKIDNYAVQERLWSFFRLIELGSENCGYDSKKFFMRPYYGRLFDRTINSKLDKWKIDNKYLLDVINLLTRTRDKQGNYFFLDYAALETRHLGSVYEHLLEYHLTIKNQKILDLPNPKDRKSSGSYYTPKYVVDYIVENSIEPSIEKIIKHNADKQTQIEKILSLKILDPAMGSGHFLVGAVEYMATRICEIEFGEVIEEQYIERKRDVTRRCIYGVDLNPLSVDLARLSLWLETLSSDKPLTFLSAHLKCGNSLAGANLQSINHKQSTLFESEKGKKIFEKNLNKFLMFESLEDDSTSAVKIKLEEYAKIRSKGTIYYDLKYLLDCKISEYFNIKIPNLNNYNAKIGENSLDFHTNDSFRKVKELSDNMKFFHWEIEFPQIFYDSNAKPRKDAGFDIIFGNPPYTKIPAINKKDKSFGKFLKEGIFESATGSFDLSALFIEKGYKLLSKHGRFGFIVTNTFFTANYGKGLRKFLSDNHAVEGIVNFGDQQVFKDASTYTAILFLNKNSNESFHYGIVKKLERTKEQISKIFLDEHQDAAIKCGIISENTLSENRWSFIFKEEESIMTKLKSIPDTLDIVSERIAVGLQTSADNIYILEHEETQGTLTKVYSKQLKSSVLLESEILTKFIKGSLDIKLCDISYADRLIIFPYKKTDDGYKVLTDVEMEKDYPRCFEYLKKFESVLKKRADCPKTEWWGHTYPRNLNIFEKQKIMTPFNAFEPSFAYDSVGYCYTTGIAGGYAIILKPSYKIDPYYLIGLLNSTLLGRYLVTKGGGSLQGGYISYEDRFIRDLPVVIPVPKITKHVSEIIKMTKTIEELKKTRKQFIKKHDKTTNSQSDVEYCILENTCKIDAHVFKLYGLEKSEIEQILNLTETNPSKQKMILELI